jgi:predicted enzyme related to lactoylglutathione lyase
MAGLRCHDDIKVCRDCIGWLRSQAGILDVTSILPVNNMADAIAFYEMAGFDVRRYDDGFAFVHYNETSVFDLTLNDTIDPATNGAGCYIVVADVDHWRDELSAKGLPVCTIEDTPWGMREFTLTDPNGNHIRIASSA